MHEVGVAKEMLRIALEKAGGRKIRAIKIELGDDGHTTPATLTGAFNMVAKGTVAEQAVLDIIRGKELESRVIELEVEK